MSALLIAIAAVLLLGALALSTWRRMPRIELRPLVGRGPRIRGVSGAYWHPFTPRAAELQPGDLAHALSLICRFGGNIPRHYSVAQHSVLASQICPPGDELATLLHDGAEALSGFADVTAPAKKHTAWRHLLDRHEAAQDVAIAERFGLELGFASRPGVKRADRCMLAWEDRDLRDLGPRAEHGDEEAPSERLRPWTPLLAELAFLERLAELTDIDVSADVARVFEAMAEETRAHANGPRTPFAEQLARREVLGELEDGSLCDHGHLACWACGHGLSVEQWGLALPDDAEPPTRSTPAEITDLPWSEQQVAIPPEKARAVREEASRG